MSEAIKNFREFYGVWASRLASIPALIFSIFVLILQPAGIAQGYVGGADWANQYSIFLYGSDICTWLQLAWSLVIISLVIGIIGFLIAWSREKIGLRISGFLLGLLFVLSMVIYVLYFVLVSTANLTIINNDIEPLVVEIVGATVINAYKIGGIMWNIVLGLWIVSLISSFLFIIGAGYMLSASPIPFAKYRAKRMKILTKADASERANKPNESINFYKQAGDLSMQLREEDKATEYYQKSREIEDTEITAVLEREEEIKRKELAERRAKLEEERKEILIRADQAEEKEQFLRASTLYRDVAEKSVDLGEKKLAAQFTAKAKELKRKAQKIKKEKEKAQKKQEQEREKVEEK